MKGDKDILKALNGCLKDQLTIIKMHEVTEHADALIERIGMQHYIQSQMQAPV